MQTIDSILSIAHLKFGLTAIVILLFLLWGLKAWRKFYANMLRVRKNKEELKRIQTLREQYKQDITTFLNSYRNDISTKLGKVKLKKDYLFFGVAPKKFLTSFKAILPR